MRRHLIVVSLALVLTGCAGHGRYEPPTVDMTGVDANRYNADVADCTRRKEDHGFIGDARMITNCMEARGYRVLEPKG